MNRNEAYWILVEHLNNYKVIVNKRPYNKLYRPIECPASWLIINKDTVIKNFNAVYLCSDELVIVAKYEDMQINVKYKDIETLEVGVGEEGRDKESDWY